MASSRSADGPPTKRQKVLTAPCTFPFKAKVYSNTADRRGWIKFLPKNAHAARISPYIEHLCHKSSFELAEIVHILVAHGCMKVSFVKAQCLSFLQRDLIPKGNTQLTEGKLKAKLLAMDGHSLLLKWYIKRYQHDRLHNLHHMDLLTLLENFLNEATPRGIDREYLVEKACHEVLKEAKEIRRDARK